jgi:hypothetical protein
MVLLFRRIFFVHECSSDAHMKSVTQLPWVCCVLEQADVISRS